MVSHVYTISFMVARPYPVNKEALKILKFHVPPMVPENSDVKLNCIFELNGFQLYSVKWYKDQTEFYSFVPRENPPIQTFRTEGIKVDLTRSKIGSVYIRNVKQSSEGTYKCELSGESPYFPLEYKTRIMKVYLAPKHAPIISGYANSYKVGDYVSVNCTSDRSKPGVHLKWYVGDSFREVPFCRTYVTTTGLDSGQFKVVQVTFTEIMLALVIIIRKILILIHLPIMLNN
ncbi:Cell adhesion molecule 3 [Nymphon striatum]|nr:Cell adhesion molecule 3 [Nymphon striatum]